MAELEKEDSWNNRDFRDDEDPWPDPTPEEDALNIALVNETNVIDFRLLREVTGEQDLSKALHLNLHGKRIGSIQALDSVPSLRTLDLSFNRITKIDGLSSLSKLKELKLYDNRISVLQNLSALTALHTLDISSNRLQSLEGVAVLRGLRVLRVAYNGLTSLEGLGRFTALETLDAGYNSIRELGTSLHSCVGLKELILDGNSLVTLKGLQRCDRLEDVRLSGNALTSLQGLRAAAATLDTLDVSRNRLSSLEGLAEGFKVLHELYAHDNKLTSLVGLATRAPMLETLDVSGNKLGEVSNSAATGGPATPSGLPVQSDTSASLSPALEVIAQELSKLPELTWVRLEGNGSGLGPGYAKALLAAVPSLDGVDDIERPPKPMTGADVWVNDGNDDLEQLLSGIDRATLVPTVEEMEAFKRRVGITSDVPVLGRPASRNGLSSSTAFAGGDRPATSTAGSATPFLTQQQLEQAGSSGSGTSSSLSRPGSSRGGPRPPSAAGVQGLHAAGAHLRASMSASRPGTASGRPGTASGRPWSASARGGSSGAAGGGSGGVKDPLMYSRPATSRTGGAARLMTPEQYSDAVVTFGETMETYSSTLRSVLTSMREGLKLDITAAAAQVQTPEGIAARTLPTLPILPDMPSSLQPPKQQRSKQQQGSSKSAPLQMQGKLSQPAAAAAGLKQANGAAGTTQGLQRPPELDDPEVNAALDLYRKVFPGTAGGTPGTSTSVGTPGNAPKGGSKALGSSISAGTTAGSNIPGSPLPPPMSASVTSTPLRPGAATPLPPTPGSAAAAARTRGAGGAGLEGPGSGGGRDPSSGLQQQGPGEEGDEDDREELILGGADEDEDEDMKLLPVASMSGAGPPPADSRVGSLSRAAGSDSGQGQEGQPGNTRDDQDALGSVSVGSKAAEQQHSGSRDTGATIRGGATASNGTALNRSGSSNSFLHRNNSLDRQPQHPAQAPLRAKPTPVLGQRPSLVKGAGSVTVTVTAGAGVGVAGKQQGTGLQPRLGPASSPAASPAAKPSVPLARPASPLARSQQHQRPPSPGGHTSNTPAAAGTPTKRPALIKAAVGAPAKAVGSPAAVDRQQVADGGVVVPQGMVKARMPGRQPLANASPQRPLAAASVPGS